MKFLIVWFLVVIMFDRYTVNAVEETTMAMALTNSTTTPAPVTPKRPVSRKPPAKKRIRIVTCPEVCLVHKKTGRYIIPCARFRHRLNQFICLHCRFIIKACTSAARPF